MATLAKYSRGWLRVGQPTISLNQNGSGTSTSTRTSTSTSTSHICLGGYPPYPPNTAGAFAETHYQTVHQYDAAAGAKSGSNRKELCLEIARLSCTPGLNGNAVRVDAFCMNDSIVTIATSI